MNKSLPCLVSAAIIGCFAQSGAAQILNVQYDTPTLDRWNYPFNGSPGNRFEMPSFGALDILGHDDHDAQVLLGFDTSADIPAGIGADQYQVLSVTVTLTTSNDNDFRYDDSHDTFDTYGLLGEPFDTDPGRPLNLWLTGYRGGQDQTTYTEFSPFGFTADIPPAQGMRNAFAATFDTLGIATDISNNLKEQFDAVPLAIGQTNSINPGDLVPAETVFSFTFTPCQLGEHLELGKMLDLGEVRFSISSLQAAIGGPDGGAGVNYPIWYTKENPLSQILGFSPTLEIAVRVGSPGDFNGDGNRDFFDIATFLTAFTNNDPSADITGDCSFDFFDIAAFLTAFTTS